MKRAYSLLVFLLSLAMACTGNKPPQPDSSVSNVKTDTNTTVSADTTKDDFNKVLKLKDDSGGKVLLERKPHDLEASNVLGTVFEFDTDVVLQNAKVYLSKDGNILYSALCNEKGEFSITNVQPGKYLMRVQAMDHATVSVTFEAKARSLAKITAYLQVQMDLKEKPVIYLYPTEKQNITVRLDFDGELVHSYPLYPAEGWNVTAFPNGTLLDTQGKEYYALFWEGKSQQALSLKEGFVVAGSETAAFLEEKLAYLGLNRREANEFIMYWLPRMEGNAYNLIGFAGKEYEEQAKLKVSPAPETVIRVMMLTKPLESKLDFPIQDLSKLKKERKGFTVVEWGGTLLNSDEL